MNFENFSQRSVSFGANAAVPPTTRSPSRNKTLRIVSLRPNGSRLEGRGMAVFGVFLGLKKSQQFFFPKGLQYIKIGVIC